MSTPRCQRSHYFLIDFVRLDAEIVFFGCQAQSNHNFQEISIFVFSVCNNGVRTFIPCLPLNSRRIGHRISIYSTSGGIYEFRTSVSFSDDGLSMPATGFMNDSRVAFFL